MIHNQKIMHQNGHVIKNDSSECFRDDRHMRNDIIRIEGNIWLVGNKRYRQAILEML